MLRRKRLLLLALDDVVLVLVDGVGGDDTADAGSGVYDAVPAQDGARIEDRVAAYLHKIPQNGAHLSPSGGDIGLALYHHRGLVRLDVGCDRAGTHVALVAQDGVAHVVVVWGLNFIEENGVLQLCRVAHHAVSAHQSGAPDKGAVAHLSLRPDDAGCTQIGGRRYNGGLVDPDVLPGLVVLLRGELAAQGEDQILDAVQSLPGVLKLADVLPRHGVGQIEQLGNRDVHRYGTSHFQFDVYLRFRCILGPVLQKSSILCLFMSLYCIIAQSTAKNHLHLILKNQRPHKTSIYASLSSGQHRFLIRQITAKLSSYRVTTSKRQHMLIASAQYKRKKCRLLYD